MSDTITTAVYLRSTGEWVLLSGLPLIVESIAYTVVLGFFAALLVIQSKRKRRRRSPLVFVYSAMFTLASLDYAIDLFWFFSWTREILLQAVDDEGKITPAEKAVQLLARDYVPVLIAVRNGSWLVSTILSDFVVLWRAWELASRNVRAKRILVCAVVVLLSRIGTTPVVLICQLRDVQVGRQPYFSGVCGNKTVVNWCLSVLVNLLSTCVIAYIGYGHRIEMRIMLQSARRTRSTAEKVLGLLAESGFIYFSVNVMFLIIFLVTPTTTYSAGEVIAIVCVVIVTFGGALVPMATQVTVLIYGSFWDRMLEDSGLPSRDHTRTTSIRFAGVTGINSEASCESAESVVHVQDVSKETANPIN